MINIKNASLQKKILLFFSLILIIITFLVSFTTLQSAYLHSSGQLQQSFKVAQQVMFYKLQNDGDVLSGALTNAAKDFNIKQLIASAEEDPASLEAALLNQQRRIEADFSIVYDDQNQISYSSLENSSDAAAISPEKFATNEVSLQAIDGQLFLVRAAPVKFLEQQPQIDAWLLMGINLNKLIDDSVQRLTGYEIAVFHQHSFLFG